MTAKDRSDSFLSGLVIFVLLVLTPWPLAMMLTAAVGLLIWYLKYGGQVPKKALLLPAIAFLIGVIIATILVLVVRK